MLRLLGLAARAGTAVAGTERVRERVRGGGVRFALVAGDASANTREKLLPLLRRRGVPYAEAYDRDRLGRAVGRPPASVIGLSDPSLAQRVRDLLAQGTRPRGG